MIRIHETANSVTFAIRVHPRAKNNSITGELGDVLKVDLTAPPVDGRGNEACIEFFARLLAVQRSAVSVASGETSRNKVIRVIGLSAEAVRSKLAQ